MNRFYLNGIMPWLALSFTSSVKHTMDEIGLDLSLGSSRWSRQAIEVLTPGFPLDAPEPTYPEVPVLPTPTDVPVPEPFDLPVPEPRDVPPPDPHDIPPPRPKQPEFDPKPRSVP